MARSFSEYCREYEAALDKHHKTKDREAVADAFKFVVLMQQTAQNDADRYLALAERGYVHFLKGERKEAVNFGSWPQT